MPTTCNLSKGICDVKNDDVMSKKNGPITKDWHKSNEKGQKLRNSKKKSHKYKKLSNDRNRIIKRYQL